MKSLKVIVACLLSGAAASMGAPTARAQSNSDLLKLHNSLNDMCRDGAESKTSEACESRELVGQMLKATNICFGELGKVVPCRAVTGTNSAGARMPTSQSERCLQFAENELIQAKGFLVEFDYAAEEVAPTKVEAVVLDGPICFNEDLGTKLRVVILNTKHSMRLGRHYRFKMRMDAGDSWSGSVLFSAEDKSAPD